MEHQQKSALLVLDMQEGIFGNLAEKKDLVTNISQAIRHARNNEVPVIYVVLGFRSEFQEINSRNKVFGNMPDRLQHVFPQQFMNIVPGLDPLDHETVVVKKRISAFAGSDLELILRSQDIHHLVLCGIVSSGVVLSTATEASDKDFQITILEDGCTDRDEEVHNVLMKKIFLRYGEVLTCNDWAIKIKK